MENYIVSKEDFKKYFNSKNEVSKEEYFNYLEERGLKYDEIKVYV